jgi:hypothetical protein
MAKIGVVREAPLQGAVANFAERAEKAKPQGLRATFVDPGIADRIGNPNNLVLYGRRGTGKTHVLKFVQQEVQQAARRTDTRQIAVYLDLRPLASTRNLGMTPDERREAAPEVFTGLIQQFANAFRDEMDAAGYPLSRDAAGALTRLVTAVEQGYSLEPSKVTQTDSLEQSESAKGSFDVGLTKVAVGGELGGSATAGRVVMQEGERRRELQFSVLYLMLSELIKAAKLERMVLILDEWSAVDRTVQPVLAQYLRHWCIAAPQVKVMIGAIWDGTTLASTDASGSGYGLQQGPDFRAVVDLDERLSPDDRPNVKAKLFQEMLYRHLALASATYALNHEDRPRRQLLGRLKPGFTEALADDGDIRSIIRVIDAFEGMVRDPDWGDGFMETVGCELLERQWEIDSPEALTAALFKRGAFRELTAASGGVFRDFLDLFAKACAYARDENLDKVTVACIRRIARDEYLSGKRPELHEHRAAFDRIMAAVTGQGTRYFLVDASGGDEPVLEALINLRVLHRVKRGVVDSRSPATHYDLLAIDLGAVAGQLRVAPDLVLHPAKQLAHPNGVVEPFDDGRVVPRVLLTPAELSAA